MGAPTTDRSAIRQVIRALVEAGHTLHSVDNGEERILVRTEEHALDEVMSVDEATLFVRLAGTENRGGWVFFVMGNEPYEVVCDSTVNLSDALDPLTDRWEA